MANTALGGATETLARLDRLGTADALARLDAISSMLPSCSAPDRLEAIAAALPRRVANLPAELALALAKLALELVHHRPRLPEDLDALSPALRIAWLRVQLSAAENPIEIDDTLLLRTLGDWPDALLDAAAPSRLLERMIGAEDPRLRAVALERLAAAVQHIAITPEQACASLLALARDHDPGLRRAAFEGLRQFSGLRLAPALAADRRALIAEGLDQPELAAICIELALALGERELLLALAFDDQRDSRRRAAALSQLGELAEDGDLERVLELARADPLLFGPPTRSFVLDAHRCGVFIHDPEIPALLDLYDQTFEWTGDELVRVAYVARHALLLELAELPANDRRWIRRAAILAASVDTDAHLLIARLLRASTDRRIAAALLDAAGRSPDFDDEDALLAWLARLPEPVIAALHAKGSERSIAPLRELVLDRRCPASVRAVAMRTLWAHSHDRRGLLSELSQRIGPRAAGLLDSSRLSARDGTAAQLLVENGWDDIEPLEALKLLCDAGKPKLLEDVTRLFRIVFTDYVSAALSGDFTIKRTRMPELEQLIYRYGRHLIADGRRVRRWIEDQPETGDALVVALAIDWLREDPPAPICVALLETLARKQPRGAALRKIQRLWRRSEIEVKRAALEAILSGETDEHGLTLSIGRLAAAENPKIVRQALIGIRGLRARWAEPLVIAALARPPMLIKREAALTLAEIGSERCVAPIIDWLARHDNVGFRSELLQALRRIAGQRSLALLVDALGRADARRERELLRAAISGMLTIRAATRLARSTHPAYRELVDEALAGQLALADGGAHELAAALHRKQLRTIEMKSDPFERLRLDGFSPAAALALLERRDELDRRELLDCVERGFAEWLRWVSEDPSRVVALELLLEACGSEQRVHVPAMLELLEQTCMTVRPEPIVRFFEQHVHSDVQQRARALALLRTLPSSPEVGGLRRWQLLGKLGALRERDDLLCCLTACRIGPQLATESLALLNLALAIPAVQTDEAERLDPETLAELERLREGAERWHRLDERAAASWLDEQLQRRPLELFAAAPWPWQRYVPTRGSTTPSSRADLQALLDTATRRDRPRAAREQAAETLVRWPAARDSWPIVLAAYLAEEIDLSAAALARLARELDEWPAGTWTRTRPLFDALSVEQRREFLPGWIAAWERAEPDADALLRALDQELLIPIVRALAERGDHALVRLLRPSSSLALRELIELIRERAPEDVAHLLAAETSASERGPIVDPIKDNPAEDLIAMLGERKLEIGLAVRAIHRLAELDTPTDLAGEALVSFTRDPRPRVRSAAFRALRSAVSPERRLAAALGMLEIETRRDVIVSLLETLGHGRYEPGFSRVVEYLTHRDEKLRDAAERALLGWGPACEPLLRRAAGKARPDRRPMFEALLTKLVAE